MLRHTIESFLSTSFNEKRLLLFFFFQGFPINFCFIRSLINYTFIMKKKIIFYLILFLSVTTKNLYSKNVYHTIQPEEISEKKFETKLRYGKSKNFIVVTANDYATKIGYGILEKVELLQMQQLPFN